MKRSLHNRLLLLFSALNGCSLVAAGLIGIGLLIPAFGGSYFIWLSIFCAVFAALTCGFYSAGFFYRHIRKEKILLTVMLATGISFMAMPLLAPLTDSHINSLRKALLISETLILAPPFFLVGAALSLILSSIDAEEEKLVQGFGIVVVSAGCGALFSLLFGTLIVIPRFGLIVPSIGMGLLVAGIPAFLIFRNGWKKAGIYGLLFAGSAGFYTGAQTTARPPEGVIYQKSGITRNYRVTERIVTAGKDSAVIRDLIINGKFCGSCSPVKKRQDLFPCIQEKIMERFTNGEAVLMLGLTNPGLADISLESHQNLTIVEADPTLTSIYNTLLHPDTSVHIIESDSRYFINQSNEQYSLILINQEPGNVINGSLFSAEGIARLRKLLKPGGLAVFQTSPELAGDFGRGNRSLYKTIRSMGLFIKLFKETEPDDLHLVIVFTNSRDAFENYLPEKLDSLTISENKIEVNDAVILTDRRPILGYINRFALLGFRESQ